MQQNKPHLLLGGTAGLKHTVDLLCCTSEHIEEVVADL